MWTEESERQSGHVEHQEERSPFKDSPPTKTDKGAGPLGRLFSPAPKKAEKAAAKSREDRLAHRGGAHEEEGGWVQ